MKHTYIANNLLYIHTYVPIVCIQILSADGTQEVGKITKQWSGLAKEYFTDADNFGIQCKWNSLKLVCCEQSRLCMMVTCAVLGTDYNNYVWDEPCVFMLPSRSSLSSYCMCVIMYAVPMDLDVKAKATLLGALFLIVSHYCMRLLHLEPPSVWLQYCGLYHLRMGT